MEVPEKLATPYLTCGPMWHSAVYGRSCRGLAAQVEFVAGLPLSAATGGSILQLQLVAVAWWCRASPRRVPVGSRLFAGRRPSRERAQSELDGCRLRQGAHGRFL